MKNEKGRISPEQVHERLRSLRKILGTGAVRSLQMRKSVFKVWRRTTPHNWWVENKKGETLWHSCDGYLRPDLHMFFELVKDTETRIWTGRPDIIGSDEGASELSIYKLKKCYH